MPTTVQFVRSGDTIKAARSVDPYEIQLAYINAEGQLLTQKEFTSDANQAMAWCVQLKEDPEVFAWEWIAHYADGTREFAMRSIWIDNGEIPEDTSCK